MKLTINQKLHQIEVALDSVQLHKVIRRNRKLHKRIRHALGLVRQLQAIWPQADYSLYRWIIDHQSDKAKLQRFSWRRYKRMQSLARNRKLHEFCVKQ